MSRPRPTSFDYMVIALSPALIMVLVGSLVYFLLEMFYQGQYPARLHFCLTMFVFAIVLVSRISMEEGWERAMPFGVALGVVVALAMHRFVTYTGSVSAELGWIINLSLMAITWWCADRLTWDCTLVDESADASGEGLLQTVGIDREAEIPTKSQLITRRKRNRTRTIPLLQSPQFRNWKMTMISAGRRKPQRDGANTSWWTRFMNRRRRPHSPGVCVVYFSLAALPIFGFGQTLIPESNTASRRYAFLLLCVYLASALGLLVTTSFLSLRRYLRQRRIEMPVAMANTWLVIGAVLIVGLLLVTAVLPRPNAEYELSELPLAVKSTDQSASQRSVGEEGTKDANSESGGGKSQDGKADTSNSADGKNDGKNAKGGQAEKSESKGGNDSSRNESKSGGAKSDSQSSSGSKSQNGQQQKSDSGDSAKTAQSDSTDSKSAASPSQSKTQAPSESQSRAPSDSTSPPPTPDLSAATTAMVSLMKWMVYGVLIGLFMWWSISHWSDWGVWLSSLVNAWREFWRKLFGGGHQKEEAGEFAPPKKSFLEFSDPFVSGIYTQYPPQELVRYSFEALEAWAHDNGCPREPEQTAYEFARQVASHAQHMAAPARTLADLYSRVAFSPGSLPPTTVDQLRTFWQAIQTRPVAVGAI